MKLIFFPSPKEFRKWLQQNHESTAEVYVGYYKTHTNKPSLTWPESVDEALCYGWIDGVRKSLGKESYVIRFTPRKPKSIWSIVNIRRVAELTNLGLMQAAGLKVFNERDEKRSNLYSFERQNITLNASEKKKFKANIKAWGFFESMPPSYRKPATWWVISAKREVTREKRLATLIRDSELGRKIKPLSYDGKKKK